MDDVSQGSLAAFFKTLRRSSVRWVVLGHLVLLGGIISLLTAFPDQEVLWRLDAILILAQVALLMIWMTLDRDRPPGVGRALGVTVILLVVHVAHAPAVGDPGFVSSFVCSWPCVLVLLGVLALPLSMAESRGVMIMRFSPDRMPPPRRLQFSIRTVLIGAIGIAVLFSLRGLLDLLGKWPLAIGADFTLVMLVMILVIAAIYLSIPLVAVWAVLTPGPILPRLATAVVGWSLGGMLAYHYAQLPDRAVPLAVIGTTTAGAIPILLATLFALRQMGFRAVQIGIDGWAFLDESDTASPFAREKEKSVPDATP